MSLRERAAAAAQVLVEDLESLELADPDVHHLARVLRLRDGEAVIAADGAGRWRPCTWVGRGRRGELVAHGAVRSDEAAAEPVTVWLPVLKGERSEWAVAKLTELGVDVIGLLVADRATVRLDADAHATVLARWRRVTREATCQSRRTRLPELAGPGPLAGAVASGAARCDVASSGELPAACRALAIGPEGGWSERERAVGVGVTLGEFVLRSETAALAAGVRLCHLRATRHAAGLEAQ